MLRGKAAIVTGSTSGIGLGIARSLAQNGANIVLNGFGDRAEIDSLIARIKAEHGVDVAYSPADMSQPMQVRDMVTRCVDHFGSVDILVNNAGIQHTAPIEEFPDDKWDQIIGINLSSAFHATKAALPHMRRRGWGRIVNIASAHGLVASTTKSAYVAAKHGLIGLTKVVALETARSAITCNAVCPGWVLTPLVQKQIEDAALRDGISSDQAKSNLLAAKQPSLEFATPDQIGATVAFLCSAAAGQIRGTSVSVDGGWTAQ
jgi:3-hydroxybutyrate dehydrogenase